MDGWSIFSSRWIRPSVRVSVCLCVCLWVPIHFDNQSAVGEKGATGITIILIILILITAAALPPPFAGISASRFYTHDTCICMHAHDIYIHFPDDDLVTLRILANEPEQTAVRMRVDTFGGISQRNVVSSVFTWVGIPEQLPASLC